MDERPRQEIVDAVEAIVRELLDQAGVEAPPIDAIALAQKHLDITISLDSRQADRGRVQRSGRRPHIYLRPEPREERHQWTVAHEIARHLRPQILERLALHPQETRAVSSESLNTLFSSRLLVPTHWFTEDARACGFDLLELKKRYRTASHQVIALRFLDLPYPTIVTIIDNGEIYRRKSNGPPCRANKLDASEKRCWKLVQKTGEPQIVAEGGWTVQGWPIHQEDWKREILRSVVESD